MRKLRLLKTVQIFAIVLGVIMNIAIMIYQYSGITKAHINLTIMSDEAIDLQLFYLENAEDSFTEEQSAKKAYTHIGSMERFSFDIPMPCAAIRLDFGESQSNTVVKAATVSAMYSKQSILEKMEENIGTYNQIQKIEVTEQGLAVDTLDTDPYIIWQTADWGLEKVANQSPIIWLVKLLACVLMDVILLIGIKYGKKFRYLPIELWENRNVIWDLAKNDFSSKFAGSYLGTIWGFIQPIIMVLLYWFVFEKGLKAGAMNTKEGIDVPFVLWLIAGLVPWFFFQDAWNGATNALLEYSYLVKKVVFKISILPIIKIISAMFVHVFFVAFMLILYWVNGYGFSVYTIQIVYYSLCVFALTLGLGYICCAIVGFFKDLTQIINIMLQIGTWLTPIMWNYDAMELNAAVKILFKLNPMFYVVEGYRDSLISHVWFWENPEMTLYFWIVTTMILGIGVYVFRKTRVHFADVL